MKHLVLWCLRKNSVNHLHLITEHKIIIIEPSQYLNSCSSKKNRYNTYNACICWRFLILSYHMNIIKLSTALLDAKVLAVYFLCLLKNSDFWITCIACALLDAKPCIFHQLWLLWDCVKNWDTPTSFCPKYNCDYRVALRAIHVLISQFLHIKRFLHHAIGFSDSQI